MSGSMSNNWKNNNGKRIPRIEVLRNVLNNKIKETKHKIAEKNKNYKNIEIFCLGLGFRYPLYIEKNIRTCEDDQPLKKQEKIEVIDLICDLVALCEILPTKEMLLEFKENLNYKWQKCTEDIFSQATIVEDVFGQLFEYIQTRLYESAIQKYRQSLRYKWARRCGWNDRITDKEAKINTVSQNAAIQYTDEMFKQVSNDFASNQSNYVALIERHLEKFVEFYVASTLQALTLGFTVTEIVDDLDEKIALSLATQIYAELDKEVKRHIEFTISIHMQKLRMARQSISAILDMKKIKEFTETLRAKIRMGFLEAAH